jgi:hypothetical protein
VGSVCRVKWLTTGQQTFRWWRGWNGGAEVAETTVKRLLCCGFRRTGKAIWQLLFYFLCGGSTSLGTAATFGLLYKPQMIDENDFWSNWWNEDWQGKPKYSECDNYVLLVEDMSKNKCYFHYRISRFTFYIHLWPIYWFSLSYNLDVSQPYLFKPVVSVYDSNLIKIGQAILKKCISLFVH